MEKLNMGNVSLVRLKKGKTGKTLYVSALAPGNKLKKFTWDKDPRKALHLTGIPEGLPPGIKVERVPASESEAFEKAKVESVIPEKEPDRKLWYCLRWRRDDDTKMVVSFNVIASEDKRDERYHESARDAIMERIIDRQAVKATMDMEIEMMKELLREESE